MIKFRLVVDLVEVEVELDQAKQVQRLMPEELDMKQIPGPKQQQL